ncbi:hypothetical protein AAFF_G00304750 [Aldrovandia affinis]|uniref:Uncharacterized protein n=1 Tax=Aldrovandia affinis TaxID=143900 RepID=A0AAD7WS17_9TELE|nr:hypothetical protein AAFF_G00304750 [Aldrovandia affinis]
MRWLHCHGADGCDSNQERPPCADYPTHPNPAQRPRATPPRLWTSSASKQDPAPARQRPSCLHRELHAWTLESLARNHHTTALPRLVFQSGGTLQERYVSSARSPKTLHLGFKLTMFMGRRERLGGQAMSHAPPRGAAQNTVEQEIARRSIAADRLTAPHEANGGARGGGEALWSREAGVEALLFSRRASERDLAS